MSALLPVDSSATEHNASKASPRLIEAARRRWLAVALVEHLAPVASVLFGGLTLALMFGTAVVSLLFVAVVTGMVLALVLWRVRTRLPKPYDAAQILDRKLQSPDTLSTAWFLLKDPGGRNRFAHPELPLRQAGQLAASVEPATIFHWRGRKPWSLALVLLVAAGLCFRARYLVEPSLDLRAPLIRVPFLTLLEGADAGPAARETGKVADEKNRARKDAVAWNENRRLDTAKDKEDLPLPPAVPKPEDEQANSSVNSSDAAGNTRQPTRENPKNGTDTNQKNGNPASQSGTQELSSVQQPNPESNGSSKPGGAQKDQGSSSKTASPPGLANQLKDALSSMLARMSNPNQGQKSGTPGDPSNRQGENSQMPPNAGQQSPSQQASAAQDQSAAEEMPNGEATAKSAEQSASSASRSKSTSQDHSSNSQSGIGSQDGEKQLREAEQQQAMGKLAEILGKRSATLTGEMTIETPQGNQKLKTAYTQEQGHHVESGGEINRNEVPARYRHYVEEYMEQVRKTQNALLNRAPR